MPRRERRGSSTATSVLIPDSAGVQRGWRRGRPCQVCTFRAPYCSTVVLRTARANVHGITAYVACGFLITKKVPVASGPAGSWYVPGFVLPL